MTTEGADPAILKGIAVLGIFVAWWVCVAAAHFWFDYHRRFPPADTDTERNR